MFMTLFHVLHLVCNWSLDFVVANGNYFEESHLWSYDRDVAWCMDWKRLASCTTFRSATVVLQPAPFLVFVRLVLSMFDPVLMSSLFSYIISLLGEDHTFSKLLPPTAVYSIIKEACVAAVTVPNSDWDSFH